MKKYKVGIIVVICFLIGVFSFSISTGDLFFTTKYYKKPLSAYNAGSAYNDQAEREIGLLMLDSENCLFIGELDGNGFVVNEMILKKRGYASKGRTFFYDFSDSSGEASKNSTAVSNGNVTWAILYSQAEIENLSDVETVNSYTHTNGRIIYLVVYKN